MHRLPVHRLPVASSACSPVACSPVACSRCLFNRCLFPGCLSREGADSAAVVAADGRAGGDADGREHDNLKCPPSNSTIWSTDCEIRR